MTAHDVRETSRSSRALASGNLSEKGRISRHSFSIVPVHAVEDVPWVISPTVDTGHWPLPDLHTPMMRLGVTLGQELTGKGSMRTTGQVG